MRGALVIEAKKPCLQETNRIIAMTLSCAAVLHEREGQQRSTTRAKPGGREAPLGVERRAAAALRRRRVLNALTAQINRISVCRSKRRATLLSWPQ